MPPLDPAVSEQMLRKVARFPGHMARPWLLADQMPPQVEATADAEGWVQLTARAFVAHGERLVASGAKVRLVAAEPFVGEVAACPWLSRVDELNLNAVRIDAAFLRVLIDSPHVGGLRGLSLDHARITADEWIELAGRLRKLERLQSLGLAGSMIDGAGLSDWLTASPSRWRSLDLSCVGPIALRGATAFANLQSLTAHRGGFDAASWRHLRLPALERLTLSGINADLSAIADARLRRLALDRADAEDLTRQAWWSGLESLALTGIDRVPIAGLPRSLMRLGLAQCSFDPNALPCSRLQGLDLSWTGLDESGVMRLLDGVTMLGSIDLSGTGAGRRVKARLAELGVASVRAVDCPRWPAR